MNTKIKRLLQTRRRAFNKAKITNKEIDWERFRNVRNNIRRDLVRAQDKYIMGILNTDNLRFGSFVAGKNNLKSN